MATSKVSTLGLYANAGMSAKVAPTAVGNVVGAFKSLTTVLYTHGVKQLMWPAFDKRLWQGNYNEHIIRGDAALQRIREYVIANPGHWVLDEENQSAARLALAHTLRSRGRPRKE